VGLCVLSPFDLGMAEFFLALAPLLLLGSLRAAGLVCKTEKYVLVMRRLVLAGLCAGACAVFSVGTIFGLYQTLSNESEMYPTIRGGDWIIGWISAPTSPIFRGELLQVGCAGRRVVGLPGDQILIEGGTLIRNGKAVREQYKQTFTNPLADFPVPSELDADARRLWVREMPADKQGEKAFIVPEGHYFILNDNRNQPRDSRTDGTFVRGEFGGRLLLALSPVRRSVVFLQ
jgi:signal peptidase I